MAGEGQTRCRGGLGRRVGMLQGGGAVEEARPDDGSGRGLSKMLGQVRA